MIVQIECFNCGAVIEKLEVVKKHRGFPRRSFRIISCCCDCLAVARDRFKAECFEYPAERTQVLPL